MICQLIGKQSYMVCLCRNRHQIPWIIVSDQQSEVVNFEISISLCILFFDSDFHYHCGIIPQNISSITCPLWGQSTGEWWIPSQRVRNAEQTGCRWFDMSSRSRDVIIIMITGLIRFLILNDYHFMLLLLPGLTRAWRTARTTRPARPARNPRKIC